MGKKLRNRIRGGDKSRRRKNATQQPLLLSGDEETGDPPYAGMGKEMVLHYSNTPGFNRARKILLLIFWLSWLVLLGAVIYLTVTHPKCKEKPAIDWRHKSSVYQIYPRSFKDSNNDGIGDLNGTIEKLDYLRDIGVDAVWISPFYESAMRDFGYDVINYTKVDPIFGTMEDFDRLVAEMHTKKNGKELKLIIDFIPNHTSNESRWFDLSVKRQSPYTDYYVWADGNATHPPNNWLSAVGGSAWSYHSVRGQWYLHQYQDSMPDLNYRNNRVKDEIDEVLRFWLEKGVDGIRVDAVSKLYEDYDLENETVSNPNANPDDYYGGYLNHSRTVNLPEVIDMVNRWRGLIDEYSTNTTRGDNRLRVLIAEAAGSPEAVKMYYGRTKDGGAHFPFNFQLAKIHKACNASCIGGKVRRWMVNTEAKNASANWVLGSHDVSRLASRVGENKIDAMNMLLLLLPGVSTTYYGEELGMTDIDISNSSYISQDPAGRPNKTRSRDPERSPMQWNSSAPGYGFSTTGNTWLPFHPNVSIVNVEVEAKDGRSHLSVFKNLTALRKEDTFVYGDWREHMITADIYSFTRSHDGMNTYLIIINLGTSPVVDMNMGQGLPVTSAEVVASTGNCNYVADSSKKVELNKISLNPGDGVVFSWGYIVKELV